jgi:predicted CoA-binding protein/signal transduction histidine kinase
MYDFLRQVPFFADLPDDDLERLCQMVEVVRLPAGQELFAEGSPGDRAYIIESGELEIMKMSGNRPVLLAVRKRGDVIGEIALLEDVPRTATARARTDSMLYAIHQEQFEQLLAASPTASRVMLNMALARWRNITATLRQSEKMAQLGTLTAGVAHELNNPAAAVKRGADQLTEAMTAQLEAQSEVDRLGLDAARQKALRATGDAARSAAAMPAPSMDPLERNDREYALETWLDDRAVPDAWELSPILVQLGYDEDKLSRLAEPFTSEQLPAVIAWLGATYSAYNLLAEISHGAARISEIVKALKSYSYLDQAPVQAVDIHLGLDNTLLILRHKLSGIKVRREYALDLPVIQGYGSELNQVWTNLIDNAIDALEQTSSPEIVLRTTRDGEWVNVEIQDNGPGIPPAIQSRIFEAFFTTKPPGKGTGLGLEISYNIVVTKHRGNIKVFSKPGFTCFQVTLPLNFEEVDMSQPITTIAKGDDDQMRQILETARTVAVVGISPRPERPSHSVPAYLQAHGYRIIPVNPSLDEALGEKAYPDLLSIPVPIDVVDIFRRSEEVAPIIEQAIQAGAKTIWMQEGIVNEEAADLARRAGLEVVMDACMRATHKRLLAS